MAVIRKLRKHLRWKLFLTYLIVILIGVIVLATAAELVIPTSFDRHLADMGKMMMDMDGTTGTDMMSGAGDDLSADLGLFANFRKAVNEALIVAALASGATALILSWFVSKRVVEPIQDMMVASRRIAEGHFDERVRIQSNSPPDEFDELARLGVSFNQMASKIERTETMRHQLIVDVTHELRTPLSTIKGFMEGLIDGVLPGEPATYQKIYKEADRLQLLVDDLQELSRVEAGAIELDIQPVNVTELFNILEDRLDHQFKDKGVELEIIAPTGMPRVSADADRIGQVLINLVGNALQYTPPGGVVALSAVRDSNDVRFLIQDTGIGIPPEHLQHIFTRFYRVDKSRSRAGGGSGIGLTISSYLIDAHGGRIWAESAGHNQGSTFIFTLPIP